jgi:hypothetical protein
VLYHFTPLPPQYHKNLFSQQHLLEYQDSPKIWLCDLSNFNICVNLFLVVLASALTFSFPI